MLYDLFLMRALNVCFLEWNFSAFEYMLSVLTRIPDGHYEHAGSSKGYDGEDTQEV